MSGSAGLHKIVVFNWPWFAAALVAAAAAAALLRHGALDPRLAAAVAAGFAAAGAWSILSLAVSHYVYDRSPVARGEWLAGLLPDHGARIGVFHAGQDEASAAIGRLLPLAVTQVFDFYDPAVSSTPSLRRARARSARRDLPASPQHLPLTTGAIDAGVVAFAAHEIRSPEARAAFFGELRRVLAPDGRAVVVEHLRDGWNFLAYGPGALHFFSRSTWLRAFAEGGLRVRAEERCTAFVRVFTLEAAP